MGGNYSYVGCELDLFSGARNWKHYFSSTLRRYINGNVLEIGCGLGQNTKYLITKNVTSWTAIEPDRELYEKACQKNLSSEHSTRISLHNYNLSGLTVDSPKYDSLIYIDVLEHIEDDREELKNAARVLKTGGHVIVLAPAYNWLYSNFDTAVGHYRRYDKKSFRRLNVPSLDIVTLYYLDSVGIMLSLLNRYLLKQRLPTRSQIRKWDTFVIPLSRVIDHLVFRACGRSVVCVWQKR